MWRLVFPAISLVLMSAHMLFHGMPELIAVSALLLALMALPRWWVPKAEIFMLILSGGEWVRAGVELVLMRLTWGQPWHLAAFIMASVALFTWLSALVFYCRRPKAYYERVAQTSQNPQA
jgi:hypothetical protein